MTESNWARLADGSGAQPVSNQPGQGEDAQVDRIAASPRDLQKSRLSEKEVWVGRQVDWFLLHL